MTEPPDAAIDVRGLTKAYRIGHLKAQYRPALRGLDLRVERGEVLGYLGPNGAGKTTTLKVIVGLLRADAGTLRVLGYPSTAREWRVRAGFLPEQPYFYDYLTVREYLDYVGRLFGQPPALRRERQALLIDRLGLSRSSDVALRRFSKGMLQRAGLAQALVNDPELVILDEPMSGLDPLGRRLVRELILELKSAGKTVLFSTHILSDAESLCDRVAVVTEGRVAACGRLDEILRLDVEHMEMLVSGLSASAVPDLPGLVGSEVLGERARLRVAEADLSDAVARVQRAGARVLSVQPVRRSLEEFFVQQVGGPSAGSATWDD